MRSALTPTRAPEQNLPFRFHLPPPASLPPSLFHPSSPPTHPPILTPTEHIPGACFARSATLPAHALTLSVPANSGERLPTLPLPLPLYSHLYSKKAVNHRLTR